MRLYLLAIIILLSSLSSCKHHKASSSNKAEKEQLFLALGDSYTIGEGVSPEYNWPRMLKRSLNAQGYNFREPIIIAETGWRTDELLEAMQATDISSKHDLVSLQIGVNNQFQGKSIKTFKQEFIILLDHAISASKTGNKGVFVLSIPDYGVTPFGKKHGKEVSIEIEEYNKVIKDITTNYKVTFYDITPISKKGGINLDLLAKDQLHPSARMYKEWVSLIAPQIPQDCLSSETVK